ncbi:MAG: HAD hydrolase family protein [Candidatus Omnitrophica bacterium]|nr:HAD hydrolase family protein [Candidatus Omnitrophota bacterium]
MNSMDSRLREKIVKIKILIIDTDGVMTKPFVIWSNDDLGKKKLFETRLFCIHDGSSCWAAKAAGLKIVLVSGRASEAVSKRASKIKIDELYLDRINKLETLDEVMKNNSATRDSIAYMGDDFLDLPILKNVGLAIAVNDAVDEVKDVADYITKKNGGEGAVAEAIRLILKAQNKWDKAVADVLEESYKHSENITKIS